MRKSICIIAFALWALLPTAKADEGVILLLNDGSSVGFTFKEKPVITTAGTLTLSISTGERVSYDYKDVKYVYFDDISTGIKDIQANVPQRVTFHMAARAIQIDGLSAGDRATVYTVGGQLVAEAVSDGTRLSISIPAEGHSVYIVKTSTGASFKFSH